VISIKTNQIGVFLLILTFFGIFSIIFPNVLFLDLNQETSIEEDKNNNDLKTNNFDQQIWSYTTLDNVEEVSISADGSYMVASSSHLGAEGYIYFFHKSNSTPLWIYNTEITVETLKISQDGKIVVAGLTNGHLFVFNSTNYENPLIWDRLYGGVLAEISSNGSYIVTSRLVSMKIRVYFYHISSSTPIWTYQMESGGGLLAMSSDGFYVAAECYNYKIYLFNKYSATPIWEYYVGSNINEMSISSNNSYLVAGTSGNSLLLFNITNYSNPLVWETNLGGGGRYAGISANGDYIVCTDTNNRLYLFNKTGIAPIWVKDLINIDSLKISSDGNFITVGTSFSDSAVYLFSRLSSDYLWKNNMIGTYNVYAVDISSNGLYIISGSDNRVVNLFYNPYPPFPFELTSNAENPDDDGSFKLEWEQSILAENYSVYFHTEYFTSIHENVSLIDENISFLNYSLFLQKSGYYYYIIVAKNRFGLRLSNCLEIIVALPPGSFNLSSDAEDPDYDGIIFLNWTESRGADNYSIYLDDEIITEINENITLIQEGITDLNHTASIWSGLHYIVAVAFNESGHTFSNNIFVDVRMLPKLFVLTSDADPIDIDGSFVLNWTESFGADNYTVYVHDSFITEINGSVAIRAEGITDTNYSISGLYDGDYYYLIGAFNEFGNTSSNCIKVHVEVQIPPLAFLLDSTADDPDTDGNFTLYWTDSLYALNYSLYYSESLITNISQSDVYLLYNGTERQFDIINWVNGTYYFIAISYNDFGNYTTENLIITIEISEIEDEIPPLPFSLDSDADDPDEDGSFMVYWNESLYAEYYSLYYSNNLITNIDASNVYLLYNGTEKQFNIINWDTGTYYFIAISYNEFGNYTTDNLIIIIEIPEIEEEIPPQPFSLSTDADDPDEDGSFMIYWNESLYADYYSLYYSQNMITDTSLSNVYLLYNGTERQFDILNWDNGTYYFMAISFNDFGNYATENLIVMVDITKVTDIPLIDIISPTLNQEFGAQAPEFTISITDTSPIVSMWYTIDGGVNNYTFTVLTDTIATSAWEASEEGNITLTFYAEDEHGNIGSESVKIIKILSDLPDGTPPKIPGFNIYILLGSTALIILLMKKLQKS